jgi:hypothetical protein
MRFDNSDISYINEAIFNIRPTSSWSSTPEGEITEWRDAWGTDKPTQAEIDAEVTRLKAEYKTQAYARSRKAEYPDWDVQLNKIYDDGIDKWKAEMVDPIKAKYPKIPVVD